MFVYAFGHYISLEINMRKAKIWLVTAMVLTIAAFFQLIGACRYVERMPDDYVGIGLYVVILVFLTIAALGFFIEWAKEEHKES